MTILAGDVGGTKTHLVLYRGHQVVLDKKYVSQEHTSLSEIVALFLSSHRADKACFGIAGPVREGSCRATNLPWVIDAEELSRDLKISSVRLLNDLEANAYGLLSLSDQDLVVLNKGVPAKGNAALIAAGTGLGEAGLYWDGRYHPFACEGGHVDFAPRDEIEHTLFNYLKAQFGHVSYERILSGPGFCQLFHFLIDQGLEKKPKWFQNEHDLAQCITQKALDQECSVCVRVLDWFVSLYGSEAGNLALKFLALGGVYIGGGIAPKILKALQSGHFMDSFVQKGRFRELLMQIPVRVILNENTALLGAVEYARGYL